MTDTNTSSAKKTVDPEKLAQARARLERISINAIVRSVCPQYVRVPLSDVGIVLDALDCLIPTEEPS